MVASYRRALDTFVAEMDGVPRTVLKGAVLPESDPVVKFDIANGARLFAPLDTGEDEPAPAKPPAKSEPAKDEPKAAAAQVKDSPPPKPDPPKQAAMKPAPARQPSAKPSAGKAS